MSNPGSRALVQVQDRSAFGRQWLRQAKDSFDRGDVFSAYFAGYIALVCSSIQLMADSSKSDRILRGNQDEAWEQKSIDEALKMRAVPLADFVDSNDGQRITNKLRLREIHGDSNSRIMSATGDRQFANALGRLDEYWSPLKSKQWNESRRIEHAEACAYLLRKVRNRLFHGEKLNDPNGSDAELLEGLCPLLFEVVELVLAH
jgi:hypothetical protein